MQLKYGCAVFCLGKILLTKIAYYIKIITPLFNKDIDVKPFSASFSQNFVLYVMVAVTVLIGVFPEKLIELCRFIAYNI